MHDHSHPPLNLPPEAQAEKSRVALFSVFAALLLTFGKIGIGWWTGSLGILAEAMHSGLDLAAAAVTLWAVRAASKPADEKHSYGHGKIENLSALFETLLLLLTCVWILKEAVSRLWGVGHVHVDVNVWSFLIMALSIAVDFSRSRALLRVARKYQSQALEADALHFSTDIWSSLVVLIGLLGVVLSKRLGIPWLASADAVAALGVALVVIWVSLRLGKKSIDELLDTVSEDLPKYIAETAIVPGVREVRNVRVRRSGPELFIDLSLLVDRSESLQRGHAIASSSEAAIRHHFPTADIVTHVEPSERESEDLLDIAQRIAIQQGAAAHNLVVHDEGGRWILELHVEIEGELQLGEAYQREKRIEAEIAHALPNLAAVRIHIEPKGTRLAATAVNLAERTRIETILKKAPDLVAHSIVPKNLEIRRCGSEFSLSFVCALSPTLSVYDAHEFTDKIERFLRSQIPEISRVMVRIEPIQ
jgi:cation diffusion facilitator family transporter